MTFRLANISLNTASYSSLYMPYGLPDEMWEVGNVVCYGSGNIKHVGCWRCVYVRDVRYWGCGMLRIFDIGAVGC